MHQRLRYSIDFIHLIQNLEDMKIWGGGGAELNSTDEHVDGASIAINKQY